MKRIKEWVQAYRICKKYKLSWEFLTFGERAWYRHSKRVIGVCPFHKHFMSVFLHEIGHHLAKKNNFAHTLHSELTVPEDLRGITGDGIMYAGVLREEVFASRFSNKVLKSYANKNYLLKCFQTYTALLYAYLAEYGADGDIRSECTDFVYKQIRKIS